MLRLTEIKLALDHGPAALRAAACQALTISDPVLLDLRIRRRGYDARGGSIRFVYTLDVMLDQEASVLSKQRGNPHVGRAPDETHQYPVQVAVTPHPRPVVIGTGPCGLFAALSLARMGMAPLVLERGQNVRQRAKDVWRFWRQRVLNSASNVQFGEGGAGTFSDGKLHSGIKDRGHHIRRILQDFVDAGAPEEILYISKPHIGTLRLVKVVEQLRAQIIAAGGEIRFGTQVTDLVIEAGGVRGVQCAGGETLATEQVLLAVGHSARDTFSMLQARGVPMQAKPFSIGFRIEHPQALIDRARLGRHAGHPQLGAADYKLVHHASNGRVVYSFCMCPGGQVVAASSEPGQVVTNGMSHYSRNERNANAGIVVDVTPRDFGQGDPLAGMHWQRALEARAFALGGGNYNAPAQRVGDFLAGRASSVPGEVIPSYTPGVTWTDLSGLLPPEVIAAIREALPIFARQVRGFAMDDAVLTAVETRTSSPIRIPREAETFECPGVRGLYPAGEGAGYAGGILSAAVDGMKAAEALALHYSKKVTT